MLQSRTFGVPGFLENLPNCLTASSGSASLLSQGVVLGVKYGTSPA